MSHIQQSNIVQWEGRPKRTRKPPPMTYWEEYVATDPWYVRELTADVPADEWDAAVADEDFVVDDAGEEGDESESDEEEEEDPDYSEELEDEDGDAVCSADEGSGSYDDESDDGSAADDDDTASTDDGAASTEEAEEGDA